jgi:hypothetical protein
VAIGDLRAAQGAGVGAEEAYRRALSLAEKRYAPQHPERRRTERALAAFLARRS